MQTSSIEPARTGLCSTCEHARIMTNDRGSTFSLCQLSLSDKQFPKYPRLPVLSCVGYHERKANE
jgi:hypothetical protein